MAADNTLLNAGSGGETFPSRADASSLNWPAGLVAYTVSGSAGAWVNQYVDLTHGLPVQPQTGAAFPVTDNAGSLTVDAPVGTPVFVRLSDGSAAITTLPVSAASLPLPTGAATAAKQPALGTAGTPSADVLSVQGRANMTPLLVDGSGVTQPVSGSLDVSGTVNIGASVDCVNSGTFAVQDSAAESSLTTIAGRTPALGQALAAASVPVVLTAAQLASLTAPVLAAGTAVIGHVIVDSGTVAATQSGTWNVGTVTTLTTCSTVTSLSQFAGNAISTNNGASGAGVLRVTVANDSTGILAGVTTVTTLTTCSTLTGGGVAHDGADSGNPVKVGVKATTSVAGLTLVSNADRTDLFAGSDGVLIVRPECSLEDVVQERTTNTDGASTAFASGLAAPGAGVRLWVKSVTICNSSATFCTVDLRDGSAGSVLWTFPVPATGGVTHEFNPPLKLTANTALAFDASGATTTLTISANGFKSKV